jgi:hypothetical protein
MRRAVFLLTVLILPLFAVLPAPAALAGSESSGVAITIVMPDKTEGAKITPAPEFTPALYPSSVEEIHDESGRRVVRTYELGAGDSPEGISREAFERNGWRYELADVTRAETAVADAREYTETVTADTATKDIQTVLEKLPPTLEFTSEDGYSGVLALNVASVKVEQAGTKTSSFAVSATREYPRLSASDTSLIPKSITDSGRTLQLADVQWRAGNSVTLDYEELPEYYTALATYTGTGSKTVVTGYVTTAEYTGAITKISQGRTIYKAYFLGAEIAPKQEPLEIAVSPPPEAAGNLHPLLLTFLTGTFCALFSGAAVYLITLRKNTDDKEKGDVSPCENSSPQF